MILSLARTADLSPEGRNSLAQRVSAGGSQAPGRESRRDDTHAAHILYEFGSLRFQYQGTV